MPSNLLRYTEKDFQKITMEEWLQIKAPALRPLVVKWFNQIKNCGTDVQPIFHDNCSMACVDNTLVKQVSFHLLPFIQNIL
ncbi:MAG: hypothetical protein ACKO13_16775 [Cytophagales bacterium]